MSSLTLEKSVLRLISGERRTLASSDPSSRPFDVGTKADHLVEVDRIATVLDTLQQRFHADKRFKLLVVLQGVDTSGKDGTLRHVFGRMSPQGVRVAGWRAPSEVEKSHDFLWRIHQAMPAAGEIVVFNRSHYEDVLVPYVNGTLKGKALAQRLAHINDFERMLAENGTVIVKFMLHISKKEQGKRLQERLDDPEKNWKFDPADLEARKHWDKYQRIYEKAIRETSKPWAPWVIVPADSKTHRNLMVAKVMEEVMSSLPTRFPPLAKELRGVKVK